MACCIYLPSCNIKIIFLFILSIHWTENKKPTKLLSFLQIPERFLHINDRHVVVLNSLQLRRFLLHLLAAIRSNLVLSGALSWLVSQTGAMLDIIACEKFHESMTQKHSLLSY